MERQEVMKRERRENRTTRKRGFTLVEMLLVVTIIGILATVVVVKFAGVSERARIAAARDSIASISSAIDVYEVDMGKYPGSLEDLVRNPGGATWHGPYIKGGMEAMTDPWGMQYQYTKKENDYEIRSSGPDQQANSADDITGFGSGVTK